MKFEVIEDKPVAEVPLPAAEASPAPELEVSPVVETPEPASAEPAASDAAPEPAPVTSAQFAALAKREKALVLREKAAKDEAAAVAERLARAETYEARKAKASEDPLSVLGELGLTFEQLTAAVLKQGEPPTADDRVAKLEARLEAEAKARADGEAAAKAQAEAMSKHQLEAAVAGFKNQISGFVKENTEKYEMIAAEDASELVFDVIDENYNKTGKLMTVEAASDMVEEYLFGEAKKRLAASKKLAGLFAPPPLPPPPAVVASKKPTLTNKATASTAVAPAATKGLPSAWEIAQKYKKRNSGA